MAMTVDTRELYDNLFNTLRDQVWRNNAVSENDKLFQCLKMLSDGDMDWVRLIFRRGHGRDALQDKWQELKRTTDQPALIVTHRDRVIGCLVRHEL